ncbi:MAG: hypothetical protein M3Z25_22845 [Actinomycetota bacterium]|nr:hypothetical protein [Actinomycetota bacterium]
MPRSAIRWVIGAAAGIVVSSGLANGAAQAAGLPVVGDLPVVGGLVQALPVGAVNGILPAGQ